MNGYKKTGPLIVGIAGIAVCGICMVFQACETKKEAPPEPPHAAEPSEKPSTPAAPAPAVPALPPQAAVLPGPEVVCRKLLEAAQLKDDAKLFSVTTPGGVKALAQKGAKEHVVYNLRGGQCGTPSIEGDHATVPVTRGTSSQKIPFVKVVIPGWRFDAESYLTAYPVSPSKTSKTHASSKKSAKGKKHTSH